VAPEAGEGLQRITIQAIVSPARNDVAGQNCVCTKVAEMLLCIRSVASLTAIARDAEIFLAATRTVTTFARAQRASPPVRTGQQASLDS